MHSELCEYLCRLTCLADVGQKMNISLCKVYLINMPLILKCQAPILYPFSIYIKLRNIMHFSNFCTYQLHK